MFTPIHFRSTCIVSVFLVFAVCPQLAFTQDKGTHSINTILDQPLLDVSLGTRQIWSSSSKSGLSYFPDEPVSIISASPLRLLVVSGNKTVFMQGRTFADSQPIGIALGPTGQDTFDRDYAGITSIVIRDKKILGMYHAERNAGGQIRTGVVKRAYWSIGLAEADPQNPGQFRSVGQILSASAALPAMRPEDDHLGIGDGVFLLDKDNRYFLAYFTNLTRGAGLKSPVRNLPATIGMARCPVDSEAAAGSWKKYFDGHFDEPGLGGQEGAVVTPPAEFPSDVCSPHVVYLPRLNVYLMACVVFDYATPQSPQNVRSGIYYATSEDGIHWSRLKQIIKGNSVPQPGKEYCGHPRFVITNESATEATGQLVYCYSKNWGEPPIFEPHYLCTQPVKIRLSPKMPRTESIPNMANTKATPEPRRVSDRISGTKWRNSNGASFEWTERGTLLHNGTERQWKEIDSHKIEIAFGPGHSDLIEFDPDYRTFRQLIRGNPQQVFTGKRE